MYSQEIIRHLKNPEVVFQAAVKHISLLYKKRPEDFYDICADANEKELITKLSLYGYHPSEKRSTFDKLYQLFEKDLETVITVYQNNYNPIKSFASINWDEIAKSENKTVWHFLIYSEKAELLTNAAIEEDNFKKALFIAEETGCFEATEETKSFDALNLYLHTTIDKFLEIYDYRKSKNLQAELTDKVIEAMIQSGKRRHLVYLYYQVSKETIYRKVIEANFAPFSITGRRMKHGKYKNLPFYEVRRQVR